MQDRIISACVMDKEGLLFTGNTHKGIISKYAHVRFDLYKHGIGAHSTCLPDTTSGQKGFLDNNGNFCNRENARLIANNANQVSRELNDNDEAMGTARHDFRGENVEKYLFSEQIIFSDDDIMLARDFMHKNNTKVLQEKNLDWNSFIDTAKRFDEIIVKGHNKLEEIFHDKNEKIGF